MSELYDWQDELGRTFKVNVDWTPRNTSHCGSAARPGCGAVILWVETQAGKRMPVNADGTSHFSSCPFRDQFRKPREDVPWPEHQ